MSDIGTIVERAMVDWWTANGEATDVEFRFGSVMERQIFDSRPSPYPMPKGSVRMIQFLGMPVLIDDSIPIGEIHICDRHGNQRGKITGLTLD